jgi:sigma-B regulation protein RsbU (phosphoserine phosphatase)
LLAAVVVPGIWGLVTRDTVTDLREIQPALAKLISERQRMKQELEIAREVQARLFPQSQPQIAGLDIAADCLPAQEVGGDYYDFIIGDDKKNLKLAIGDVSGKGTKAAFYMTLVKGFLKALARQDLTPAELLRQLNSLFFENTRNDAFVSMIYAMFTLDRKEVIMARSGHNPVIHYHCADNSIETIRSEGLALGLEKGELFNRMIEEIKIPLQNGDLFVFYTDGLTEAMNKQNQEYGEERLHKVILENKDNTARKLMEKIYQGVHNFDKGTAQHDDMTLIVVKVAME